MLNAVDEGRAIMRACVRIIITSFLLLMSGVLAMPVSAFAATTSQKYVALGDSVAAGLGVGTVAGTNSTDRLCKRSTDAYPQQVANALKLPVTTVACSGARSSDLYAGQSVAGTTLDAQINAAFAGGKPTLITLTVGANDLAWPAVVRQCYVYTCGGDTNDVAAKAARGYLRVKLFAALARINYLSNYTSPPRVLITGYYIPLSFTECSATQGLTTDEMSWLNGQVLQLNRAIYSVTPWFSFTSYVPVNFTGHELCSADPWIQGFQSPAPFHPTAAGQRAIAASVLRVAQ